VPRGFLDRGIIKPSFKTRRLQRLVQRSTSLSCRSGWEHRYNGNRGRERGIAPPRSYRSGWTMIKWNPIRFPVGESLWKSLKAHETMRISVCITRRSIVRDWQRTFPPRLPVPIASNATWIMLVGKYRFYSRKLVDAIRAEIFTFYLYATAGKPRDQFRQRAFRNECLIGYYHADGRAWAFRWNSNFQFFASCWLIELKRKIAK